MAETLKMYMDGPTGAVCTWGPVVYVVWRGLASFQPIEAADLAIDTLVERYGDGRKILYVQRLPEREPGAPAFRRDNHVMQGAMAHFERHDPHVVASAVAIESKGFGASVFRSIAGGIMLVRRTEVKTEIFTDAREGVRWLHTLTQPGVNAFDAAELIVAVQMAGLALKDPRY
jgi:hypothetical protein